MLKHPLPPPPLQKTKQKNKQLIKKNLEMSDYSVEIVIFWPFWIYWVYTDIFKLYFKHSTV